MGLPIGRVDADVIDVALRSSGSVFVGTSVDFGGALMARDAKVFGV